MNLDVPRILVVDDDNAIADVVVAYLERDGMTVKRAYDGEDALISARETGWDLILLDVMMPKLDGFEVCRRLRMEGNQVPIIFLTARGGDVDQVLGLGLGGDDYITKPFSAPALVARVKAHLRRYHEFSSSIAQSIVTFGDLAVDTNSCTVHRGGQEVALTAKEFQLLRFLLDNKGHVLTRKQIFTNVWGEEYLSDANTVTVHIRRLREKIEKDPAQPEHIITVRGLGYRFAGGA